MRNTLPILSPARGPRTACALLIAAALAVIPPAQAQPRMWSFEAPLEGTAVLSINVDDTGFGHAVLVCEDCEDGRIRLQVTPESELEINGEKLPMTGYRPGYRDIVSGFYAPETQQLTRLHVAR